MSQIVPTVGRIVLFTLTPWQADEINKRRADGSRCIHKHRRESDGTQIHVGNPVKAGQVFPAMVVAVWGDTPQAAVNLKVMLDGTDNHWVTSTSVEDSFDDGHHTSGHYHWMPYQLGQAAKHSGEIKPAGAAIGGNPNISAAGHVSQPTT